ncbi:hypothetical protein KVP10_00030 [Candidimonas humi]|jgi:hypothetical protein|uniref:Uncharacterized protein n=1 Tax=Candidimonas humi TaxID=683355 RepID=A0ABV8NVP6_9BURK|nr:hypothetical protein [Candidimonas humi]MBV6303248.1 hypothetical protein [Candidimonas humi]
MPAKAIVKTSKTAVPKAAKKTPQQRTAVRILTIQERIDDMRAFGREQSSSKAAALSFLQRAGIVTPTGKLAKPFRAA